MPKCTAALLAGIVSDALNLFKIHMFDISLSLTPTNIVTNNKRWDFVSRLWPQNLSELHSNALKLFTLTCFGPIYFYLFILSMLLKFITWTKRSKLVFRARHSDIMFCSQGMAVSTSEWAVGQANTLQHPATNLSNAAPASPQKAARLPKSNQSYPVPRKHQKKHQLSRRSLNQPKNLWRRSASRTTRWKDARSRCRPPSRRNPARPRPRKDFLALVNISGGGNNLIIVQHIFSW